jgi:hypothetical protein
MLSLTHIRIIILLNIIVVNHFGHFKEVTTRIVEFLKDISHFFVFFFFLVWIDNWVITFFVH